MLRLSKGETVLDVGCGTGRSFELLLERVGRAGRVVAFEEDPDIHQLAQVRAQGLQAQGWNIEVHCADAAQFKLDCRADAALFHHVHDISRSPEAVSNLFSQLPPGTRIAISGMKFCSWWLAPLNLWAWMKTRRFSERARELHRPWSIVESHLQSFTWKPTQRGLGYIGSGRVRGTGL
jgi:demethylmenaquinone methyltransferase/2-methoxy-6-polyprenyl-1,4-benzoquinol methylase